MRHRPRPRAPPVAGEELLLQRLAKGEDQYHSARLCVP